MSINCLVRCFLICCPFLVNAQTDRQASLEEFNRLDSIFYGASNIKMSDLLEKSKRMVEIARILDSDTLLLDANQYYGQALEQIGVLDAALKVYYESLALAESNKHCLYHMRYQNLIGRVYQTMGDFEKSQTFIFQAKQSAIDCGLFSDTILLNYELGFNQASTGEFEAGIRQIEQNIQAAKSANRLEDLIFGLDNLLNLYSENNQPEKALIYALELLKFPEAWEGDFENAQLSEHLAEVYVKLKDWDKAQAYQKQALALSLKLDLNNWIYECYKLQYLIDEGRGNYKSALKNHQLYMTLKDSVYQDHYDEKMAAMSALYELETKQKAIAILKMDQEIKAAQIQEQRVLMLSGLLTLLLIIVVIRSRNQRKTSQMREAFSQDLISAQEQERQRISKELHDSVGQNILFVKNRLQRLPGTPDPTLRQSVDAALEEVRSIAKDLYPNQLEQYGLVSAVDALCDLTQESSGIFVSSDLQGIDEKLNKEAKINCYRIIQECISNTLKHAEASAIRITSTLYPEKVELIVQDNGKGFDTGLLERNANRSFGMINMAERIKMLRGKFDLESATNKGTKFTFSIPVTA